MLSAIAAVFALTLVGCGPSTYQLQPTDLTPSATGKVEVEDADDNENYKVDLEVKHMAPPKNLGPSLSTYVVWLDTAESAQTIKVGQLKVNEDSREADIEFTTPYSDFEVLVTAEPNKTVGAPGNKVVLRQRVSAGG
jgi:hypothetical protein